MLFDLGKWVWELPRFFLLGRVENAQKWIKVHNKTSEFEHFTTMWEAVGFNLKKEHTSGDLESKLSLKHFVREVFLICLWRFVSLQVQTFKVLIHTAVRHRKFGEIQGVSFSVSGPFPMSTVSASPPAPLSFSTNFFLAKLFPRLFPSCCKNSALVTFDPRKMDASYILRCPYWSTNKTHTHTHTISVRKT